MGDAHECVVDGVHEGVQRVAVGADDHVVGHGTGLEGDFTANEVVEGDVLVGHAQTPHGLTALGAVGFLLLFGEVAVVVVVAELRVLTGCLAAFLHLVGGGEVFVHVAAFNELFEDLVVDTCGLTLGLAVGFVGAADADAFVPVDAEPVQGFEHLVERLFGVACASVSSMRKISLPPVWRAYAQLKRAVRTMPTCGVPVGEGQKRTRVSAGLLSTGPWYSVMMSP